MTTDNVDLLSGGDSPKDTSQGKPSPAEIRAMLVGEGKPFKTDDDLAVGKYTADQFIEQLKAENAEMRGKLASVETSTKTNELLQTIMAKLGNSEGGGDGNQPGKTTLSREEIVTMVRDTVSEQGKAQERKANRFKANSEVLKQFGGDASKAKAHVQSRAEALGLNYDALGSMAETSPQAFLALMGIGESRSSKGALDSLPAGGVRPGTEIPGGDVVVRNFAYYKKLRKEIGEAKYYQPKIQQQLIKDRKALGEEFFDKQT